MGAVYHVTDLSHARTLALKTIRGDPRFVDLLKIEFRTLTELRHPHLRAASISNRSSAPRTTASPYISSTVVTSSTRPRRPPGLTSCRALASVHSRGVVHRLLCRHLPLVTWPRGRRLSPTPRRTRMAEGYRRAQATRCFIDAATHADALGAKVWEADAHFEHGLACLEDEGLASHQAQRELERALALYRASGALPREARTREVLSTLVVS